MLRRPDTATDAELLVLEHDNGVLRRNCEGHVGTSWSVAGGTPLAWYRRLSARRWDYSHKRGPGHPSTKAAIEEPVLPDLASTHVDGLAEAAIHDRIRRHAAVGAVVTVAHRLQQ